MMSTVKLSSIQLNRQKKKSKGAGFTSHSLLFTILLLSLTGFCQQYNDTLFFKSGMERPCHVRYFDSKNLHYTYTTGKGLVTEPEVKISQLKYFVVYDSLGGLQFSSKEGITEEVLADTSITEEQRPDSMFIRQHILSVNPFSTILLGLNISYTYRFGQNRQYGIHIPARIVSPLFSQGNIAFYTGVGFTAFIVNTEKYSMTLDFTPSIYMFGGENPALAFPVTMGFVRYLKPWLAIDGRIGAGPGIIDGQIFRWPLPMAHIGLAFLLGDEQKVLIR